MEPLSLTTRRVYSIVSFVVFLIVLAFAIFYASGYHIQGLSVVETGAIYVSVPVPDALVSLNGATVGKSALLTRGFFLDNLAPGVYVIEARAADYHPWSKTLVVVPKIVTEVSAFLIPMTPMFERVSSLKPALESATSTPPEIEGGLAVSVNDGVVMLSWTRSINTVPAAFCIAPESCVLDIIISEGSGATGAAFFNEGIVYQTPQGIYLAEVDVKEPRLTIPLYPKPGATFRIDRDRLFITYATSTYEVSGF